MTLSDELSKPAELRASGALTEDEFARAKAGLLNAQGTRAEESVVARIALALDPARQESALPTEAHGFGNTHLVGRRLRGNARCAEIAVQCAGFERQPLPLIECGRLHRCLIQGRPQGVRD